MNEEALSAWEVGSTSSKKMRFQKGYSPQLSADIDGDGRLDYCVIGNEGDLICWRNGGLNHVDYWEDLGRVWTSGDKGLGNFDVADMRLGEPSSPSFSAML